MVTLSQVQTSYLKGREGGGGGGRAKWYVYSNCRRSKRSILKRNSHQCNGTFLSSLNIFAVVVVVVRVRGEGNCSFAPSSTPHSLFLRQSTCMMPTDWIVLINSHTRSPGICNTTIRMYSSRAFIWMVRAHFEFSPTGSELQTNITIRMYSSRAFIWIVTLWDIFSLIHLAMTVYLSGPFRFERSD